MQLSCARAHAWARIETNSDRTICGVLGVARALTRGGGLKEDIIIGGIEDAGVAPALTRGRGLKPIDSTGNVVDVVRCARAHAWARIETGSGHHDSVFQAVAPALTRGRGLKRSEMSRS